MLTAIGDGCRTAPILPGTPPCDYSASHRQETGRPSSTRLWPLCNSSVRAKPPKAKRPKPEFMTPRVGIPSRVAHVRNKQSDLAFGPVKVLTFFFNKEATFFFIVEASCSQSTRAQAAYEKDQTPPRQDSRGTHWCGQLRLFIRSRVVLLFQWTCERAGTWSDECRHRRLPRQRRGDFSRLRCERVQGRPRRQ